MGRVTRQKVKVDESLNQSEKRSVNDVDVKDEDIPSTKRIKGKPKKEVANKTDNTQKNKVKNGIAEDAEESAPKRSRRKNTEVNYKEVDEVETTKENKKGKGRTKKNVKPVAIKVENEVDDEPIITDGKKAANGKGKLKKVSVKQEKEEEEKEEEEKEEEEKEEEEKEEEEKEEEEKKPVKSTKGKKSGKAEKKEVVKKSAIDRSVVKKGAAAVDGLCPIASTSHVYCEGKEEIWDCMLNQTNIQFNNNKYYIVQLLEDDNKKAYSVWMRWGRVGCNGQNSLKPFGANLKGAKATFEKKFSDKTYNEWDIREMFDKVPGKYDLLKMDYSDGKDKVDDVKVEEVDKKPVVEVESTLAEKVRCLITLICDVKAMEAAVVEMKYDAKKAPLGKLTTDQVKAGYLALKEIENALNQEKFSNNRLLHACNAFYTRIPHYFGMKVPPMIHSKKEIQEKMKLLEALGDIQAALNIINQPLDENINPIDQHYNGLKCDIETLDKEDSEYILLEKYLKTTHGKTHSMYKLELVDIFKVTKEEEKDRFKDVGNRMMLWHGSRLTNWAGILSQGLRIAPPEAPCTGYMFGKGIYFADMSSKSANYCMPSYKNNTGLLVLCDVSLGKCNELINANCEANELPKGCHSVKGVGTTAPPNENYVALPNGTILPMGPGVDSKGKNNYSLQYNEYIVYDVAQVMIKYLFKVKFNF